MVSLFNLFRSSAAASAERPQGLKACGDCSITHTSSCGTAIIEITQRVAAEFREQGAQFNPADNSHLGFLAAQLEKKGLTLNRDDKVMMGRIRQASAAAPRNS